MKPHILPMTSEDRPSILKIAQSLPQHFTKKGLALLETDLEGQKGFVYRMNDKVVGFVSYFFNQSVAEIGWMGVHLDFQRQKIGTELTEHLKQVSKKNGCSSLVVKTLDDSVKYPSYELTRAFYLKNGFKRNQVIQNPENPEWEAELVLKMDL